MVPAGSDYFVDTAVVGAQFPVVHRLVYRLYADVREVPYGVEHSGDSRVYDTVDGDDGFEGTVQYGAQQ